MVLGDAQAGSGGMWGGRWGGAESRAPGDPVGQALGVSPCSGGAAPQARSLGNAASGSLGSEPCAPPCPAISLSFSPVSGQQLCTGFRPALQRAPCLYCPLSPGP